MKNYNLVKILMGSLFAVALTAGAFAALTGDAGVTNAIVWPIGNAPDLG